MITKIEIVDNERLTKRYAKKVFKNGDVFEFKPGVNIMIGPNGSGKTTLLETISDLGFCSESMVSELPNMFLKLMDLFDDDGKVLGGAKIHCDWGKALFRYLPVSEMKGDDMILKNADHISLFMSRGSTGENMMTGLGMLFKRMFDGVGHKFPINGLEERLENANDVWKPRIQGLLDYYSENKVEGDEYTILMDEPDRNLDINNIGTIEKILSFHKPLTQIIAVIHNPLLIYRLRKKK